MIVCHCRSVSDSQVRLAIGGSGDQPVVCEVDDVTRVCGAGGDCGGCRPVIASLLEEAGVALPLQSVA